MSGNTSLNMDEEGEIKFGKQMKKIEVEEKNESISNIKKI